MLEKTKDFSEEEAAALFESIANNFNVNQVYAFKEWYNKRYFNKELLNIIHLIPFIVFFEIRKAKNGTLAIVIVTSSGNTGERKDYHYLLLIDKNGANTGLDLDHDDWDKRKHNQIIFEQIIDESSVIYSK